MLKPLILWITTNYGKFLRLVTRSSLTFCDPIDYSPPGSSVHGDSPGKNTGVGCHALLQGIFPTQESNPGLPYCRQILYYLSHQGSQGMGIPYHLSCLLRNLCAGQEATVRKGDGTTNWFQFGKGVPEDCILSPCLFSLYAEYIIWNAGLDEAQGGIKIAGRNINNLRYANDNILMAESEEELKSLLMKVKE